jgi:predicted TIM-barrel fold metal-dependent hydrolase
VDRILVVSADGHAGALASEYRDYIEAEYVDDLVKVEEENEAFAAAGVSQRRYGEDTLEIMDPDHRIRNDGELGAWELDRRLAELDHDGIAAEVVLSGTQLSTLPFFHPSSNPYPADMRRAGARAYHRHLADMMAASGGRMFGIADPGPCLDMDDTVKELRWAAEHGYVGVHPPGQIDDPELSPLYDEHYEPFWAACAELGLVLNAHAGYGTVQGAFAVSTMRQMLGDMADEDMLKMVMTGDLGIDKMPYDSPPRVALTKPRRIIWQMMLGGVFDRHPELKLILTEVRADWVPDTIAYLDQAFESGRFPTKRRPREYWETNFAVCPSSPRPYEIALRDQIGVDRFLFGADYPHPEGTWPNTFDWIRNSFAGVSEADARKILGENAIRLYGLDRASLAKVTERIGPTPEDVLGDRHQVDERLVETFHGRSGYKRPAEQLDPGFMDSMIEEDVVGATA